MILVDTSVWVDHLRAGDPVLVALLERTAVAMHAMVLGELACGNLQDRQRMLGLLQALPRLGAVTQSVALAFLEQHRLCDRGLGFVDVHLLASVHRQEGAALWTRDKRLWSAARELGCAFSDSDPRPPPRDGVQQGE